MSQLPASFKPRRLAPAFALVCALLLSYLSIRNALAAHYAGLGTLQGYQRATRLEAGNFENWHLLGRYWQYNLEDPDPTRAIRAYRVALSLNPRSAEIWGDLGAAQEAAGNITAARDAFLHAKKAYPLSADVSWSYGNFLLRQGESDAAFLEMRRAVEAEPRRGAEALSRALRANPSIEGVVDRVLPPVSDAYLFAIVDQTSQARSAFFRHFFSPLQQILDEGVRAGELRQLDTAFATQALFNLLDPWTARDPLPGGRDTQQLATDLVSLVVDGIGV